MLISLTIGNWLSFGEKAEFSLVATREQQHRNGLFVSPKFRTTILPISVIYGANSAGKSNFIKILSTVKWLVIAGTTPDNMLPIEPYLLQEQYRKKPSFFSIELLWNGNLYEYSFSATREKIISEKLVKATSANKEKVLFERSDADIFFANELPDKEFLYFIYKGTRNNQLFLTNSLYQNCDYFRDIYDFFHSLEIIIPSSQFQPFERFFDRRDTLLDKTNEYLKHCGVDMNKITCEKIDLNTLHIKIDTNNIKEGQTVRLERNGEKLLITKLQGQLIAEKMVAVYNNNLGKEIVFDLACESEGTRRVIDLLPAIVTLCDGSQKTYVIDELDRSLHPGLTRNMIALFLESLSGTQQGQLIFTTHNTDLIDQKLFRRDEMWIIDRLNKQSKFVSFSDYRKSRHDRDLRKSYLQGRLGGVPPLCRV